MGETNRRDGIPAEIVVAALVLAASLPIGRLFETGRVGGIVVLSSVLALVTSWGTRRLRFPPVFAWFTSMMCMLWWIALLFFRDSLWGPFPSADTFEQIGQAIRVGAREIYVETVPVVASDAKMMFVAAGVWVTAWLVEAAALWIGNALLAIACAVPMFVVPGALMRSERRILEVGLFVVAAGVVLATDQARRVRRLTPKRADEARASWRAGPTARLTTLVALAVVFVTPLMPGYGDPPGFASTGSSDAATVRFNPLVAIKPTLDNTRERLLFTVSSSRPSYYRLTSLETFTGDAWIPGAPSLREGPLIDESPEWPTRTVDQSIRMSALAGDWLPAAFNPVVVRAPEPVSLEVPTRALIVPGGLGFGGRYEVRSKVPAPDADLLDQDVDLNTDELEPYLRLPRSIPRSIRDLAREVTKDERTQFRKSVALQEYLRNTFTYDQEVAAGHSFDTLEEFLFETKAGYCEQFAGSMAVLLRILGIPSRVSIGFARGTLVATGLYDVTTEHAHAWVEVFFPQAGWVLFEPTPRGGITRPPSYTQNPNEPEANNPDQPAASATPSTSTSAEPRNRPSEGPDLVEEPAASPLSRPVVVLAALLIGALVFALALRLVPRLRRGRAHSPAEAVWGRYADYLAWCASAGVPRSRGQTPLEHAGSVARAAPEAAAAAGSVATLVAEALWAPPNGLDPAAFDQPAEQVRAALLATLPKKKRLLTTLGWGRWRSAT